jgi:hypothetical protein
VKGKEHEPLVTDNLKRFQEHLKTGSKLSQYEGLLALLSDAVDTAAAGSECYVVIGLNRNRDTVMCTVTIGREKLYATGPSLLAVSDDAKNLLSS